jgi:DNA-binding MarR family transcriptional regulator
MNGSILSRSAAATDLSEDVLIALRKIIQSISLNSRSLLKRVGLTGPQLLMLHTIARSEKMSVGEIARAISLSQGTVTGILERLEKRGLAHRDRDLVDRRRVMVRITDPGRRILAAAPPLMQEAFVERFLELHDWEQSMILSALQRLVFLMDARKLNAAPFLVTDPVDAMADSAS